MLVGVGLGFRVGGTVGEVGDDVFVARVTPLTGLGQRGFSVRIEGIDVCSGVDKEKDDVEVTIRCCGVEEGAGCWGVREGVWVLSVLEKESDDLGVVLGDGLVGGERDVTHLFGVGSGEHPLSSVCHGVGHRCTCIQKNLGRLQVAAIGAMTQGRVPVSAAHIHPGVSLVDQDGHHGRHALVAGRQDGRFKLCGQTGLATQVGVGAQLEEHAHCLFVALADSNPESRAIVSFSKAFVHIRATLDQEPDGLDALSC